MRGSEVDGRICVLGIDVGGTSTKLAIVSGNGTILDGVRYPSVPSSSAVFLSNLCDRAGELMRANACREIYAVGLGIKSLTDFRRQRVASSSLMPGEHDIDLNTGISQRLGLPVVVDNDVNAMALAELLFGWGREARDFVYINVGTGVGACPILNRRPYRGVRSWAGEISACLLESGQEGRGPFELESVASGSGCDLEARRLVPRYPDSALGQLLLDAGRRLRSDELFEACRGGDGLACAVVSNMAHSLAMALLSFEALLDCGLYIFGGGVIDDWFLGLLGQELTSLCPDGAMQHGMRLSPTMLGTDDAGVIGAASLALFQKRRR